MHTVEEFYDSKRELQASLKSGAKPVIAALIQTYKDLLANPLVFTETDQREGSDYLHVLHGDYKLLYRVVPEFQGESTLIAQHVFLMNIIRRK
jgi:uncharacterized protein involved in tellurium resistance